MYQPTIAPRIATIVPARNALTMNGYPNMSLTSPGRFHDHDALPLETATTDATRVISAAVRCADRRDAPAPPVARRLRADHRTCATPRWAVSYTHLRAH